jgi:hypothetical protein
MKERLRDLLSEVGESFDYLRSDVRNLSRYMTELEELVEGYRAFASAIELSTQVDRVIRRKLFCEKHSRSLGRHQTGNQNCIALLISKKAQNTCKNHCDRFLYVFWVSLLSMPRNSGIHTSCTRDISMYELSLSCHLTFLGG